MGEAVKTIKFKANTSFLGRNGAFVASGMEILNLNMQNVVEINPLTSRGITARCFIQIPKDNIDELIEALQEFKNK